MTAAAALVALLVGGEPPAAAAPDPDALVRPLVVVDQAGYRPDWPKRALVVGAVADGRARLLDEAGATALSVALSPARPDPLSGEPVRSLDFSELRRPGRYQVAVGDHHSPAFEIGAGVFRRPLAALLRSLYLQRCGVAVKDAETGLQHRACHLQDGRLARADRATARPDAPPAAAGSPVAAPGGWHDAGDYGKYVATTAVTVARLLFLQEHTPALFDDALGIPESGNGVPDLLDEARVGIEWLLAMQRPDGAVYRKLSGKTWPKGLAPDADAQARLVYGVSTPETGKTAAALAQAARVFRARDPAFAERCLAAARRAWAFLQAVPEQTVDWAAEDDSGSGKYLESRIDQEPALRTDADDRLAAAAELWLTTRQADLLAAVRARLAHGYTLFEWKDPSGLALQNLLLHRSPLAGAIRPLLLARARRLLADTKGNGYGLANTRLVWGSNKMTAEEGITLALAHRLTGDRRFLAAAIDQVDFLFGRNPFGLSFVTGVGARAVSRPCHLWTREIGRPFAGLLVGGPNPGDPSGHAPRDRRLLSYRDDPLSYGTNEPAIDYGVPLLALIALLTADTPLAAVK